MATAKPGSSFEEVKPLMRTFDLLLFRGTDFISNSIARIEARADGAKAKEVANFTHVGIVIMGDDLLPCGGTDPTERDWLRAGEVYVFESTMSGDLADGCHDVHGETHLGCQLRLLSDVVEHYDKPKKARMAWCALQKPVPAGPKSIRAEYEKYRGVSYDLSVVDLAACAFPSVRKIRDNSVFEHVRDRVCRFLYGRERADAAPGNDNYASKWQFCSEMVCNIYKDVGLIPDAVDAENVMPADFVTDPDNPGKTLDSDGEVPPLFTTPMLFHA